MPKVTIDGQVHEFDGSHKLLQFCLEQGVELPHFCYHPAMSIPANCRQCLVKVGMPMRDRGSGELKLDDEGNPQIQYFPKLQTSCSVDVSDGMVVHTHRSSDEVERAQKDNLEFLLVNHPLDCPICDQAGQCPLQIQAYKYGPEGSRFEFRKVHKPKRVKLGPNVMLDAERCINCTRCTRFTSEVSGSHQLTITQRGVKNYPLTPPGVEFDDPYSMNVVDICPVGALTSIDFRFQARHWEMSSTPSITTTNAKGSNCDVWVRDNLVLKITPRANPDVNEFWLPDEDRLNYKRFNEHRPEGPQVMGHAADWDEAYRRVAELLQGVEGSEVLFVGSAHATTEDNYLLTKLADAVGAETPHYIPHIEPGHGDDWLRTDDRTPNAQGCERLGMRPADASVLKARLADGGVKVLYVMEEDPIAAGLASEEDLDGVDVILHHYNTTNETLPHATVALPAAMIVETIGTFVNCDGRAQRVRPAKAIRGTHRPLMMEMGTSRADQHGTPFDRWHNDSHKVNCKPGWDSLPAILGLLGHDTSYKGPKEIMAELSSAHEAFAGATYEAMGLQGVQLADIGETV